MRCLRAVCLLVAALSAAGTLTATAHAAESESAGGFGPTPNPLERAKEESGLGDAELTTRFSVPAGRLDVTPSQLLAGRAGQRVRFTVALRRPAPDAALLVRLPARWLARAASGLPGARAPALRDRAGGRAGLRRRGTLVELAFAGGETGDRASFEVTDVGIPAGTYALPFYWRDASGRTTRAGTARVVFYAPSRDAPPTGLASPGAAADVSNDANDESETFIAVDPADRNRIAAGVNWQPPNVSMPLWITADAGLHWTQRVMPQAIDAPGKPSPEAGKICCDPTLAADALGNIWYGGLTQDNGPGNPSRIVVNRIAAGTTTFQSQTVGLPIPAGSSGTQDKPMMTIDNAPGSPTFGRLYVVWDAPASGGVRVVVSTCDTRPLGAGHCDNADNWTAPAAITPTIGSYIYADVAVGPTGKAFVTWWDYSSANAIRGASCDAPTSNCASAAGWSGAQTVAALDATGGVPIPFACPTLAQPGGRAAPDPQVDVDRSGGPNNGRVYVTWGDLRSGSGSSRCADGTPPQSSQLSWDSFVAVGATAGVLPGSAAPSDTVGTPLLSDGEGGGQLNSDDWFPWLAVDQSTGQAWADFYSTRDDASRASANFYARAVTVSGSTIATGTLTKVSTGASNYSGRPCCQFGNDYGDYTGLDAAGGVAYPVWTDNSTGDGEVLTYVSTLGPQPPTVATGSASGVDQTSATVSGTVGPNGQVATYHFDYGTTNSYGSQTSESSPTPPGGTQSVSAGLSSLAANTTYHYRLVAKNATGTSQGADQTFTTAPTLGAPTAATAAASGIDEGGATLNASVNPQGLDTTYHFDYGTTTDYGQSSSDQVLPGASPGTSVSASVSGLAADTVYHYRLVASNTAGNVDGGDQTFTTGSPPPPNPPPDAVTGDAPSPTQTSVTVRGTVNPKGQSTGYHFEYGTSTAYGSQAPVPDGDAGSGSTDVPVTATLTGLSPNNQYHFRLVAGNGFGTTQGQDATFTTQGAAPPPPSEPSATTVPASGVTSTAATLNATVNPNGHSTNYFFEYGTMIGLGDVTGQQSAGSGTDGLPVATTLSGLAPGTRYYFRVVAQSGSGTTIGQSLSLITAASAPPGGPGPTTPPPSASGASGAPSQPHAGGQPAFRLTLAFPSQRLGTVLSRRALRASATCATSCRLAARLTAAAATARHLGLTRGRRAVELGRASVARTATRRTKLSIPLSRRARRALATQRTVVVDLRVAGTPLDGRTAITRAVQLKLRRAGRSPSVTALRASAAASPVWRAWDPLAGLL